MSDDENIFAKINTLHELKDEIPIPNTLVQENSVEQSNKPSPNPLPVHRLNDLDSAILEEKAYVDVEDHMLKLECRISKLEKEFDEINLFIDDAKKLGTTDELNILNAKKEAITQELFELNKEYEKLDIATRLSGGIANAIKRVPNRKIKPFELVNKSIKLTLSKISKKFNSGQHLKSALGKLSSINRSVDDLVNMQIPYGEKVKRYEMLTQYLNHANSIHYQITKDYSNLK